jgi:HAD superfamily hydrolase (TIGR01509 family)
VPLADLPVALLWDMDGTLLDTEPLWHAAEFALAARFDAPWTTTDAVRQAGTSMADTAAALQARGVRAGLAEIADALNGSVRDALALRVPWRPGAVELLARVRSAGVRQALVTTTAGWVIEPVGFTDLVDVVVHGGDVQRHKPDPEPYATAVARLGVPIAGCVAVEDSASGVASAAAAGARVVLLESAAHVPDRPGLLRVAALDELDLEVLSRHAWASGS